MIRIVGYGTETTGSAKYQGVGSFFFSLGANEEQIDLTSISVEVIGGEGYMDPWGEYLRQINPVSAGNLACYTYINEVFCDAVGLTGEDVTKMVGWYKWQKDYEWHVEIANLNDELKVAKGEILFDVHQAFLGQFQGACDFHFVCNGQVVADTTELQTGAAKYYMLHNWTPCNVNLTDVEVEVEGGEGYMDPWGEYLRFLNPASAGNLVCYTYINEVFCDAIGLIGEDVDKMVGWYKWQKDYEWDVEIANLNTELKLKDGTGGIEDVVMTPGYSFLGNFQGACNFHFKMPNPVAPAAK